MGFSYFKFGPRTGKETQQNGRGSRSTYLAAIVQK